MLAGAQSGKTSFGPIWLHREIRRRGPGDYLVVTPTYPLLIKKALPEFLRLFKRRFHLGSYNTQQKIFTFSEDGMRKMFGQDVDVTEPTQVFFGHATDPESLESATAKAAWLDEAGQKKFKLASWEAIQRRLAIHAGRALITTTPYDLGYLKQQFWDKWEAAKRNHPEIDIINFPSIQNPAFPKEEFERQRRELPAWKFGLFFLGLFTRPAGLIYDCFEVSVHVVPRFRISNAWHRYLGLDFGGVNTAGIFLAAEQDGKEKDTGRFFAYREYLHGSRSAKEHAKALLQGELKIPRCVGGSHSEGQWRREFAEGGLPVSEPPVSEVEVGIDRVYGTFKRVELLIFEDLLGVLEELGTYSRELNDMGEPTEKIADKETFHRLDALRYIMSYLKGGKPRTAGYEIQMVR